MSPATTDFRLARTALVVDDDPASRLLLRRLLEGSGWSVSDCSARDAGEHSYDRHAVVVARASAQGLSAAGMRGLLRQARGEHGFSGAEDAGGASGRARPLLLAIRDGMDGDGMDVLPDDLDRENEIENADGDGDGRGGSVEAATRHDPEEQWDEILSGPIDAEVIRGCVTSIDRWLKKFSQTQTPVEATDDDAGDAAFDAAGPEKGAYIGVCEQPVGDHGAATVTGGFLLSSITDRAPVGLVIFDAEKEVVYANQAHYDILGIGVDEAGGIAAWLRAGCPDIDYADEVLEAWRTHIWQKLLTRTFTLKTRGEKLRDIEFRPRLLDNGQLLLRLSDVTESRRMRDALAVVQAKFKAVFFHLPLAVAIIDRTGRLFDVNPAFERLTGQHRLDLLRCSLDDCLAEGESDKLHALEPGGVAEAGASPTVELLRMAASGGGETLVEVSCAPVERGSADCGLRSYFFRDVTEENMLRRRLQASQEQNRALLGASSDAVVLLNRRGRIEDFVVPEGGVFGKDPSPWIGRDLSELLPGFGSGGSDFLTVGEVIRSGAARQFRFEVPPAMRTSLCSQGSFDKVVGKGEWQFQVRVVPCGGDYAVATIRDVTLEQSGGMALRREEVLRDHLNDAILVCSTRGRIEDWNGAAERIFGYRSHEILGCGLSRLYSLDDGESGTFNSRLSRHLNDHGKWSEETKFVRKDGSVGRCEVLFLPVSGDDGKPVALIGIHRPLVGD